MRRRQHPDRERSVIERSINRLKRYCWIVTRSDKLASTDLAMVTIASILIRVRAFLTQTLAYAKIYNGSGWLPASWCPGPQ